MWLLGVSLCVTPSQRRVLTAGLLSEKNLGEWG